MEDLTILQGMFDRVQKRIIEARMHVIGLIEEASKEAERDPSKAEIYRAKADAYREVYDYIFTQKSIY